MLIGFKVRNFRSLADEQAFSFTTSSDREHATTHCIKTGIKSAPRLSRAAVVFGPNGSGKTNLICALGSMRDLVLNSPSCSASEFAERHTPYRLGHASHEATFFEVDVLLGGMRYRYSFAHDRQRVLWEKLLAYSTGKSQRWFERRWNEAEQRETWEPFSQSFIGPRAMWRDATRGSALFLATAAQLNSKQLAPLFSWFEHGIDILHASEPPNLSRVASSLRDATFRSQMLAFLHAADVRVTGLRVPDPEPEPPTARTWCGADKPRAPDASRIQFSHSSEGVPVWFDANQESSGIRRLACLFGPLLAAIENGKLLLVDEFDSSLHPLVARYLLQLVNDPAVSNRGAQLLLTSHNTTLMDVNIMRRDQIWLMTLDERNASVLTPLWRHTMPPRKQELIGKSYLRGRYGAVPAIHAEHFGDYLVVPKALAGDPKPLKVRSLS